MTYRSHVGAQVGAYSNETHGFAQSWMAADILALQYLYGADFETNAGRTVYSWRPDQGTTFVNGAAAISPEGNRIFATVWDGGGTDVFDLRAFSTGVEIDLAPGAASTFSREQLAELAPGHDARGNIFNAFLYKNDTRSMIENAIGGRGDDLLVGNFIDNALRGNHGADRLIGKAGADKLYGQGDDDVLLGGGGADKLLGGAGGDRLLGGGGRDMLRGGTGADQLYGGRGGDRMTGDAGADSFVFSSPKDAGRFGGAIDRITDFECGVDTLVFDGFARNARVTFDAPLSGNGPEFSVSEFKTMTRVLFDADGDGQHDMRIDLMNTTGLSLQDLSF